jgi:broad specificity phosphatase PhoE
MPAATTISTIRHAHTEYNAQRRYAGRRDVTLSETGVQEARAAAAELASTHFDVVITSPLRRAVQTAEIFAAGRVPIQTCDLCMERNFGVLEGLTWDEVRNIQPPILLIQVGYDLHTVNPKGAEPFEEVWQRARGFRQFLFQRHQGLDVLIVSHGVFLQLFHGLLRGLSCIESLAFFPGNLELSRFRFEGERLAGESCRRLGQEEIVSW